MSENQEKNIVTNQGFVGDIRSIINEARATAVRSVDFCRVQMFWNIGRRIFEEEQQSIVVSNENEEDKQTLWIYTMFLKIYASILNMNLLSLGTRKTNSTSMI